MFHVIQVSWRRFSGIAIIFFRRRALAKSVSSGDVELQGPGAGLRGWEIVARSPKSAQSIQRTRRTRRGSERGMMSIEGFEAQIESVVRPTTIVEAPRLDKRLGVTLILATETFQWTGSFKFRAAYNVASNVPQKMIIAASSGNFGQAMAYACSLLKKSCTIVMPVTSAKVKVEAVIEYGGHVDLVDVRVKSRADRVRELSEQHPEAYIASAYDDPLVIEGNGSLGIEIGALERRLDMVVAPVGGGGLISGLIKGLKQSRKNFAVVGAEPLLGNDAARSLRAGHIVANESEPQTIADGARTLSLGKHNWEIIQNNLSTIVEVPEGKIIEAARLLFEFANLKVEPTGALSVAAVLTHSDLFLGRSVCCVISGGNVDPAIYASMLNG
jgi:threonine dehydratase